MFENLDDPRKQALLMAAAGLFAPVRGKGWSGFGEALSQGIQGGLLGLNRAQTMQAKLAEEKQRAAMRDVALANARREQDFRAALASEYNPGTPSVPYNDSLGDGSGGMIPGTGPTQGFSKAMAIDPVMGTKFKADWAAANTKEGPKYIESAGRVIAIYPDGTSKIVTDAPAPKPAFQPGQTRTYEQGRVKITEEFQPDGKWKRIGSSAIDKPESDAGPKAPNGYRWKPDMSGLEPIPGGPSDPRTVAKVDSTAIAKNDARQRVDKMLNQIESSYQELAKMGGAVSTALPARQNIQNRLAASDAGQLLGGALGTQEQSIRNSIRQSIPLLMNEIRSATGMSAKAMDSNAELQFYLRAATDPTMDIEANLRAIKALRETYGMGAGGGASSGASDPLGLRK